MAEREIILEQMLKVLKDIETNTCDKEFMPNTILLEKKLDHIIELHERMIHVLQQIANCECSCKRKKKEKKEKKDKKDKKEESKNKK